MPPSVAPVDEPGSLRHGYVHVTDILRTTLDINLEMIEDSLRYGLVHDRWLDPDCWPHIRQELFGAMPLPMRLVVPWKYGFKGIKSIVKITLTDTQPRTTWNELQPNEYGFYANVNPEVDHPRWSQATERVIGGGFFAPRIDTLKFNGYEDEVAGLYDGMDLAKFY